jgi:hypothetical protein
MEREPQVQHPDVVQELRRMHAVDQAFRRSPGALAKNTPDKVHTMHLKQIIEKIGWPTISKVGEEGARHAWTLAQHSDQDVEFQERCLELMKAEPEGEVDPQWIAELADQILKNKEPAV